MLNSIFSRENPNFNRNVIIGVAVILMLAAFNFLARFFFDNYHYNAGHNAYITADCETAMSHFDKVIQSNRNNDFGNLKAMARAKRNDCELFQTAVNAHQAGKLNIAISNYLIYLDRNTTGQHSTLSQKLITEILTRSTLEVLTTGGVCLELEKVFHEGIFRNDDPVLPFLMGQCGNYYRTNHDFKTAIYMYEIILDNYQDPGLLISTEKEIFNTLFMNGEYLEAQGNLEDALAVYEILLEANPDSEELKAALPNVLFKMAKKFAQNGDHGDAIALFERILAEYSQVNYHQDVKEALAQSLVADARASGAGTLPTPEKSGNTKKGSTRLILQNDSPEKLRIVITGPETRIEELSACSTCRRYSEYSTDNPEFCPEKGPIARYTLPPGEYDVLVESSSDKWVIPWTGHWVLSGGDEYYSCFIIKTR